MKSWPFFWGSGIFFLAIACPLIAGESFEEHIKQSLAIMEKLTGNLTEIKDKESAEAIKPELKKSAEQWLELRKKAENSPPPSKEEKDKLAKEYRPKLEEARKKLFGQIDRVRALPGGKEALQEIAVFLNKEPKS